MFAGVGQNYRPIYTTDSVVKSKNSIKKHSIKAEKTELHQNWSSVQFMSCEKASTHSRNHNISDRCYLKTTRWVPNDEQIDSAADGYLQNRNYYSWIGCGCRPDVVALATQSFEHVFFLVLTLVLSSTVLGFVPRFLTLDRLVSVYEKQNSHFQLIKSHYFNGYKLSKFLASHLPVV